MFSIVEELEQNLGQHTLMWEEFAPKKVIVWVEIFFKTNVCCKEIILLNMMPVAIPFIRDSTIEVFSKWEENEHLFSVVLAPSDDDF